MPENNLQNIQYHSTELIEQQDEMKRILRQTYPPYNTDGINIEDMYAVRSLLEDVLAHTSLLHDAVEKHMNEPPKSFWQRLLNK